MTIELRTTRTTRRKLLWQAPALVTLLAAGTIPERAMGYGRPASGNKGFDWPTKWGKDRIKKNNNCAGNDLSILKNPHFRCRP